MEGGAEGEEACFMGVMESNERGGGRNSATQEDRNRGAIAKRADCRGLFCRKEGEGAITGVRGSLSLQRGAHCTQEGRPGKTRTSFPSPDSCISGRQSNHWIAHSQEHANDSLRFSEF